ncbi:type III secretion apparatus protein, HrpE/YscL family [Burkholderia oklahomensis]|uniref:Type III secretion apparatus protein, HrpE/YscL family n=1 Tax=Burkholderia oklahomensis TaxID=342113 RepID=A0AAI8BEV8_9BURK|nr:type III secretion apparatus protein, HrpE/YscL family [Burkholderia oklahomensis]AJX35157.1 type III secretion apparatus protein, HrpE/YscL family [Burkholderia oklahomensis C6786]AOI38799.1 type III secretion system protein [Burkholderia oklahomensis EO147]AOI48497.1 type III secretion system protein [Burkholderia oklahomensis C6786]KUY48219.1 type III secretion system protein [Burkholderia oklahomensis C6786]
MRSSTLSQFPDTLAPLAGVLLKRAPLSQAARADRLLDEARRRAQRLVRDAESEADACRAHAATAGYEAGFARAIAEVAACIERIDMQRATLLERVVDNVRCSLEHLLDDPDLLLRIVNALASRHACAADRPLRVSVPTHAKRIAPAIRERLNDAYPSAQVVVADTRTFVVESDEDILEFDPRVIAHALGDAALAACRAAARIADDDALERRATIDALDRLE